MDTTSCGRHQSQTCSFNGPNVVIQQSWWLGITLFGDAPSLTLVGIGDPNANSWFY
jgi:hypothetical protein